MKYVCHPSTRNPLFPLKGTFFPWYSLHTRHTFMSGSAPFLYKYKSEENNNAQMMNVVCLCDNCHTIFIKSHDEVSCYF